MKKLTIPYDHTKPRAAAYPPIADQLDALFHALEAADAKTKKTFAPFLDPIRAVKAQHPKTKP